MSIGQRGLWFEQQADPNGNAYNLAGCVRFSEPIEAARLDRALAMLAERHALLRARFALDDGQPVWRASGEPLRCRVLAAQPEAEARDAVAEYLLRPYDLEAEHPYRFVLAPAREGGTLFGIGCHHIASDLHSIALVAIELDAAYASAPAPFAAPPAPSYDAFAEQQREFVSSPAGAESAAWWSERLAGVPSSPWLGELESGSPGPAAQGGRIDFAVEPATAAAVASLALHAGATPFAVMLTAFQCLFARRLGQPRVVVGAPSSGRNDRRYHATVGYFVNLLPMALEVSEDEPFDRLLARNGADVREALHHGRYPFAAMVRDLQRAGAADPANLVQATLTYQKTVTGLAEPLTRLALGLPGGALRLGSAVGEFVRLPETGAQFPIGIAVAPAGDAFAGCVTFDPARVSRDAAQEFLGDWMTLLARCGQTPGASVGALLDGLEGDGGADLAAALDAALERHAACTALSAPEGDLSYADLRARSDAIVARLRAARIGPGHRVAVVGTGGAETICALVGVLRAGAAFVPIDADIDPARAESLLRTAQVSKVIACEGAELKVIPAQAGIQSPDAAWLMFTSGTTGPPKAAVVPHEAALAHARGIARRFRLRPGDRVLQFASLSFDEHAEEIFPSLLAGACIVCRPRIRFQDPETLLAAVDAARVTVLHLPTSYWHLWMDETQNRALTFPPALRLVNVGGEQASVARLRTWARQAPAHARWINTYGLTEAAVTSLVFEARGGAAAIERMERVPAGRPLAGTRVRIVGEDGRDVAPGATGELLLGGAGVGLGYFGNAEATAARFFVAGGLRWLRTGDLAHRDARGDLVVVGRKDRLLKVRGMRVDPAEIEAAIGRHPAVLECVVAGGEAIEGGLELYVAVRPGYAASEPQLLDFWRAELPDAPPPRRIGFCGAIPRTAGRKPDFAALRVGQPAPPRPAAASASSDALHATVAETFARVLQRDAVDADANFFSLGGHSLLAMRVVAALRHALGVELTIGDFLAQPTVAGVAAVCRERTGTAVSAVRRDEPTGAYPLSRAQARTWAMVQAAGAAPGAKLAFDIRRDVDIAKLERAWRHVVSRHALLWATIGEAGNDEGAAPPAALQLPLVDGKLVIEGSYLAIDGGAARLLLDELAQAYETDCREPARPPLGYRRFVAAEAAWLASPARAAATAYWEETLRDAPAPTRLSRGRLGAEDDYATCKLRVALGPRTRSRLLELARARQCTPFTVLLAAFATLAARFAGTDDVMIGVPVSVSQVLGLGEVAGPTLNPIPFRLRLARGEDFAAAVARARDGLGAALAHAALPIEEIAACSPALRAARGAALPLQFVAQDSGVERGTLALTEVFEREGRSPAELLVGVRVGERVELTFEYARAAVAHADAVALARSFRVLLGRLLADPDGDALSTRMVPIATIARQVRARPVAQPENFPSLLHGGLEAAARESPDGVALVHGDTRLTYFELDQLANRHATKLAEAGVASGDRVEIASRKGIEEIVAVLGALKAGAIYVPIAADMPAERAQKLRARAGVRVPVIPVDMTPASPCRPPRIALAPDASAYILFTSGSTGEPKGVEVSHRAALLTIGEMLRRFGIGPRDVLYGLAALDFDLSVFDVFGAFIARAPLVLPSSEMRSDAFAWAADVGRHGVTVWNSVPSALDMLLDAAGEARFTALRRLLVSGDWIGLDLPPRARKTFPSATFVALGGATEAAIWSNCTVVDAVDPSWRSVPYGRALDGHSMFVAEASGWPAPAGVTGEILIGGGGLAKGYRDAPELTAERFVAHPVAGERVYRTGDLGRYLADGAIEFLGRGDRQVKVRGHRIETAEVEAALASHPAVQRVVVAAVASAASGPVDALAAYVVPNAAVNIDVAALRRHVEARLPAYMRPAMYCVLQRLPLTANGKVDFKALPRPGDAAARFAEASVAELAGNERRIALAWRELLPHREPRRDEDFFAAGGHSLLAVRLIARMRQELGVELSLPQWLREPTIAHLARMADAAATGENSRAPAGRAIAELRGRVRLADDIRFTHARAAGEGAVLVTGAAGLIGRRLVAGLARQGGREIVCMVRAGGEARAEALLRAFLAARGIDAGERLRVVGGDLARARLGLTEAQFRDLAARVGTIIHCGATVNLVAGYGALEAANVGGTHEALRLAALAGADFHHVSSVGVLPYGAGKRVLESDPIDVEGVLLTGYCETKWVAERTVRLAMERGMRGAIYRPGLTLADEDPARDGGVLACALQLARAAGALPRLDIPLDLVGADYVAGAIVRIAADLRAQGGTFHLTHPEPVKLADFVRQSRLPVPLQDFGAWRERIERVLPTLDDPRVVALGALIASQDEASITPAEIDCRETLRLLEGSGLRCAPVREILAPLVSQALAPEPA